MSDAVEATDRSGLSREGQPLLGPIRLAIGLSQGLALWALERSAGSGPAAHRDLAWPATVPELYLPLVLIAAFVPVLLLAGVGRMRTVTLAIWVTVAAALLALMGWHEVARQSADTLYGPPFLNGPMPVFAAAALFIGHHLILPADMERRWIAAFPTYFDTAWKAAVQLALSLAFTGVFWVLLFLGAALFRVIGLGFLETLTRETWFAIPVTTFVFSVAVHLTDVRDGLIRGVRAVGLMLLSWLLLVITVLTAGFVVALPFTGLKGLWDTGSASALILAAVAALIILINAAYQDGREENRPPLPLRLAVQAAALLLVPVVLIAFWGLILRINQHGLTPDRIIALACAIVGATFAGGYAWASVRTLLKKSDWMRPLEPTTLAGGALAFVLILALFSPIADPARLSVADQVARLERGAVKPEQFDFRFLHFDSGKAGRAALERLTRSNRPDIASRARSETAEAHRWRDDPATDPRHGTPKISVWPVGATLPETFLKPATPINDNRWRCVQDEEECLATFIDLTEDGRPEILLGQGYSLELFELSPEGRWTQVGVYELPPCLPKAPAAIRAGNIRPRPAQRPDLTVNGFVENFRSYNNDSCGSERHTPRNGRW